MNEKIGRNEPCWCGSGKKFKQCHYRREHQNPPTMQEVLTTYRKGFSKPTCLHPDAPSSCRGKIVKAHTIQKNGGLDKIARNSHVYTLVPQIKGLPIIGLEGINKASTFTGFCGYHDKALFSPIEDFPIAVNKEHALLLTFRAFSKELYLKRQSKELTKFTKTLDKGKDVVFQRQIQGDLDAYTYGLLLGIRDLEALYTTFSEILSGKRYNNANYYVVWLSQVPDFMCSGICYPEFDFAGNQVVDLVEVTLSAKSADGIAFSLLATDIGGIAYFSWMGTSKTNLQFVQSFHNLSDDDIPDALLRFAFEYFENIYVSPSWWDNLSDDDRAYIERRIYSGIVENYIENRHSVTNDGKRLVSWKVTMRETNLSSIGQNVDELNT